MPAVLIASTDLDGHGEIGVLTGIFDGYRFDAVLPDLIVRRDAIPRDPCNEVGACSLLILARVTVPVVAGHSHKRTNAEALFFHALQHIAAHH